VSALGAKSSFQISKPRRAGEDPQGFSIFSTKLSIEGWSELKGHGEVVWTEGDERFWGLTADFPFVFEDFISGI
jgi:hypothetical protein